VQQAAAAAVVVAKPRAPLLSDSEDIDIDSPDNSDMDSDDARDTEAQAAPSGSAVPVAQCRAPRCVMALSPPPSFSLAALAVVCPLCRW
jgi:hypothetical protein